MHLPCHYRLYENIANTCIAWTCHWLTFLGLYESTYSLHCTLNEYLLKSRLWLRVPYLGKKNANLEVLSITKLKPNHTYTTGGCLNITLGLLCYMTNPAEFNFILRPAKLQFREFFLNADIWRIPVCIQFIKIELNYLLFP